MCTILEAAVEGLAGRLSREALVLAVQAVDPGAVVTLDPATGQVWAETELDPETLGRAIRAAGVTPLLPA